MQSAGHCPRDDLGILPVHLPLLRCVLPSRLPRAHLPKPAHPSHRSKRASMPAWPSDRALLLDGVKRPPPSIGQASLTGNRYGSLNQVQPCVRGPSCLCVLCHSDLLAEEPGGGGRAAAWHTVAACSPCTLPSCVLSPPPRTATSAITAMASNFSCLTGSCSHPSQPQSHPLLPPMPACAAARAAPPQPRPRARASAHMSFT